METRAELLKEFGVKSVYSRVHGHLIEIDTIDAELDFLIRTKCGDFYKNGDIIKDGENMLFLDANYTEITRENLKKIFPKRTIKDAKSGDVIVMANEMRIIKEVRGDEYVGTWGYKYDGGKYVARVEYVSTYLFKDARLATDEEKKQFLDTMHEAGFEWNKYHQVVRGRNVKSWKDIKFQIFYNPAGNIVPLYDYDKNVHVSYPDVKHCRKALAEAKILQILAQSDYLTDKLAFDAKRVKCYTITAHKDNSGYDFGVVTSREMANNVLRFEYNDAGYESAQKFLDNNLDLVKDYLMVE